MTTPDVLALDTLSPWVTGVSLLEKEVNRAITKVTITIGDSNVCVPFI